MTSTRIARSHVTWSNDGACTGTAFDHADRPLARVELRLDPETHEEFAARHGASWQTRIEESVLKQLRAVLDLRYPP